MAGLFDGLQDAVMNPLFLGGAGLATGGGAGLFNGISAGMQGQKYLTDKRQQAARESAYQSLFSGDQPEWAKDMSPAIYNMAKISGPEAGLPILTSYALKHPEVEIERRKATSQIAAADQALRNSQLDYEVKLRELNNPASKLTVVPDGAQLVMTDPRSGKNSVVAGGIGPDGLSKDYRKAYDKEMGESQAKATIDLPRIQDNSMLALKTIQDIKDHPGRSTGTGTAGMVLPYIPGSDARGFANLVDQAKGKVFLEAFNSLRGGGAITDAEGAKATQALARLDRAQSDSDFNAALSDLEDVITLGSSRAERMARGQYSTPAQRQPAVNNQTVTGKADHGSLEAAQRSQNTTTGVIHPMAIQRLKSNPTATEMKMFDEVFGAGAAKRVLGGN